MKINKYKPIYKNAFIKSEGITQIALAENEGGLLNTINGPYLFEAVIDIKDEKNDIINILNKNKSNIINSIDINEFLFTLNELFKNKKIKFYYTYKPEKKEYIGLATTGITSLNINVYCLPKINLLLNTPDNEEYLQFVKETAILLAHESIHRHQILKVKYEELRPKIFENELDYGRKYLSNIHEIMAYAWQSINNFRLNGIKDKDIKTILQTESRVKSELGGQVFKDYHEFFKMSSRTLKRLYKYMYDYLEI